MDVVVAKATGAAKAGRSDPRRLTERADGAAEAGAEGEGRTLALGGTVVFLAAVLCCGLPFLALAAVAVGTWLGSLTDLWPSAAILVVALALFGLRHGAGARPAGGVLGAVLAAFPALLCCSPVLPFLIATIAGVLPAARALGAPIQGFIAMHGAIHGRAGECCGNEAALPSRNLR